MRRSRLSHVRTVKFSPADSERLQRLAQTLEVSQSHVIRRALLELDQRLARGSNAERSKVTAEAVL